MKLYHISQSEQTGYDTYDSAVVVAESEDAARIMHPDTLSNIPRHDVGSYPDWTNDPSKVQVIYLGIADASITEPRVICASFNAG